MSSSISQAFKALTLSSVSSNSDHENVFEVSYQYLAKIKNFDDLKAFKNCLVALINLDRYYKAYDIIKKIKDDGIKSELVVDIAYVLYKIGKTEELEQLYETLEVENPVLKRGLQHVVAQNYYKDGEFEKALALYEVIYQDNQYDSTVDLDINERAIVSQLNLLKNVKVDSKPLSESEDNYDLIFNEALIALSLDNYGQSLKLLGKAEGLCKSQNSGLPEEELNSELLPIQLTIHYIHQISGDTEKSLSFLSGHDLNSINDAMFKLLIKNNYYSINREEDNLNLVQRDLSLRENIHKLLHKMTKFQFRTLIKNLITLRYSTNTLGASFFNNSLLKSFSQDFPEDLSPIMYKELVKLDIKLSDLADDLKTKSTSRKLFKHINSSFSYSKQTIALTLVLISLNSIDGHFDQSLPLIEKLVASDIENEKVTPGIVGILVKLYESTNAASKLNALLKSLSSKFRSTNQNIITGDINYYNFIKFVAFKLFTQDPTGSRELFEILHNVKQNDVLVSSVIAQDSSLLTPIDKLASERDIEELLATDVTSLLPSKPKVIIRPVVKKSTRKKSAKFAPNKVLKPAADLSLDEERWLPMKLRSYYKPAKKDKKKGGSHQGAVENTDSGNSTPVPVPSNSSKNKKKKKSKK